MRKFIVEICILSIGLLISFFWVFSQADGYTDAFYSRFTTPTQRSLILGTSRAAQGLQPSIINKTLDREDLYNYAFTVRSSPYGEVYFNSIKKKLNAETSGGLYIISVDPWSISSESNDPDDHTQFRENGSQLEIQDVTSNPNLEYMLNYYDGLNAGLFVNEKFGTTFLHDDGWLEMNISMDESSRRRRLKTKRWRYEKYLIKNRFSQVRMNSLGKLIEYLNKHGEVFLVRLPVHPEIMELDNVLLPDFDKRMNDLCARSGIQYLSLESLGSECGYTDGNHLDAQSGRKISLIVGDWIKSVQGGQ